MAHFRGTLEGSRGQVSRLGTKNSGVQVTADGWDVGAGVDVGHRQDPSTGLSLGDRVLVCLTGGSNQTGPRGAIAHIERRKSDGQVTVRFYDPGTGREVWSGTFPAA